MGYELAVTAFISGLIFLLFLKLGRIALPIIMVGFVILFMLGLGGCVSGSGQTYIELGTGYNTTLTGQQDQWNNGGAGPLGGATIEAGREWDVMNNIGVLKLKCRYLHVSHWFVGPPFNNTAESSLDHVGCATRYNF